MKNDNRFILSTKTNYSFVRTNYFEKETCMQDTVGLQVQLANK